MSHIAASADSRPLTWIRCHVLINLHLLQKEETKAICIYRPNFSHLAGWKEILYPTHKVDFA